MSLSFVMLVPCPSLLMGAHGYPGEPAANQPDWTDIWNSVALAHVEHQLWLIRLEWAASKFLKSSCWLRGNMPVLVPIASRLKTV
jgi:hypothetical protein